MRRNNSHDTLGSSRDDIILSALMKSTATTTNNNSVGQERTIPLGGDDSTATTVGNSKGARDDNIEGSSCASRPDMLGGSLLEESMKEEDEEKVEITNENDSEHDTDNNYPLNPFAEILALANNKKNNNNKPEIIDNDETPQQPFGNSITNGLEKESSKGNNNNRRLEIIDNDDDLPVPGFQHIINNDDNEEDKKLKGEEEEEEEQQSSNTQTTETQQQPQNERNSFRLLETVRSSLSSSLQQLIREAPSPLTLPTTEDNDNAENHISVGVYTAGGTSIITRNQNNNNDIARRPGTSDADANSRQQSNALQNHQEYSAPVIEAELVEEMPVYDATPVLLDEQIEQENNNNNNNNNKVQIEYRERRGCTKRRILVTFVILGLVIAISVMATQMFAKDDNDDDDTPSSNGWKGNATSLELDEEKEQATIISSSTNNPTLSSTIPSPTIKPSHNNAPSSSSGSTHKTNMPSGRTTFTYSWSSPPTEQTNTEDDHSTQFPAGKPIPYEPTPIISPSTNQPSKKSFFPPGITLFGRPTMEPTAKVR